MTLLSRFDLRYPIIQAPMAGISTPSLAAAVTNAGGLGSISVGSSTTDDARHMIEAVRAASDGTFNVNVFCHAPAIRDVTRESAWIAHLAPLFAELGGIPPSALHEIYISFLADPPMQSLLLDLRPPIISFHFGLPPDHFIRACKDVGIYLIATATSQAEAQAAQQAGMDAVVAQGIQAGGHRGVFDPDGEDLQLETIDLVKLIVGHAKIPIIAAGAIMTGADIAAALDAGAIAVQMGTAFVACPESAATADHRARMAHADASDIVLTDVISGRPARGLRNRLIDYGEAYDRSPAAYPLAYDAAKQLNALAVKQGKYDYAAQWAGTGAARCRVLPAAELVALLVRELDEARGIG